MGPEFEDERIRRWRLTHEEDATLGPDPSVLQVDSKTEEIFEGRTYALGQEALELLIQSALRRRFPLAAAVEFGENMSFRFVAKRSKESGMITFLHVFGGLGDRHVLERQDDVTEERYRSSIRDFEDELLATGLVDPPLVITRDEWQAYEEGMRGPEPPPRAP